MWFGHSQHIHNYKFIDRGGLRLGCIIKYLMTCATWPVTIIKNIGMRVFTKKIFFFLLPIIVHQVGPTIGPCFLDHYISNKKKKICTSFLLFASACFLESLCKIMIRGFYLIFHILILLAYLFWYFES